MGHTALHCACQKGHLEVAKLLVEKGADISARSLGEWTPLHSACFNGHLDVVKWLVSEKGADTTARNMLNVTPLELASGNGNYFNPNGHPDVVAFLTSISGDGTTQAPTPAFAVSAFAVSKPFGNAPTTSFGNVTSTPFGNASIAPSPTPALGSAQSVFGKVQKAANPFAVMSFNNNDINELARMGDLEGVKAILVSTPSDISKRGGFGDMTPIHSGDIITIANKITITITIAITITILITITNTIHIYY